MLLAHIILIVFSIAFAVIGIGFLWAPVAWARGIELEIATPTARTDVQATYGGFVLAFGIYLAFTAFHVESIWLGTFSCGLVLAGFAVGRLIGILREKKASRLMAFFLAVEIVGAALSFYALTRLPIP
jgi:hypothetical protein